MRTEVTANQNINIPNINNISRLCEIGSKSNNWSYV